MFETLDQLIQAMKARGATRVFVKKMASNDNSKNQIYLGSNFSSLNIIPHGKIYIDSEDKAKSIHDRAKADIQFYWIDKDGIYVAPCANLILYPSYPEVRLSGLLKKCTKSPSELVASRDEGRLLILGTSSDSKVYGYITKNDSPIKNEFEQLKTTNNIGIFQELNISNSKKTNKQLMLEKLFEIYKEGWIISQKLKSDGTPEVYAARNGGGYTLESRLGITPNSYSQPDFLGWEVKQYAVKDFIRFTPNNPITLMTPEPTGGIYQTEGTESFLRKFGYNAKNNTPDRINFGGVYKNMASHHKKTTLRLEIIGYNQEEEKISDMEGSIALVSTSNEIAAKWAFPDIMAHWTQKHAQAVYVPSLFRQPPPEYKYGPQVLVCEGTSFEYFIKALSKGIIYYDPGIKMENASSNKPEIKKRSQFRIKYAEIKNVYQHTNIVDLTKDI